MGVLRRPLELLRRRLSVWLELPRARNRSRLRVEGTAVRRLLVLCYGNIYRSPFAAHVVAASLGRESSVEIRSAGFHPRAGRETPKDFIGITERYGINLGSHRSSLIDQHAVEWADLIVIMDRHNWDALGRFGAAAQRKAIWLGAFLDDGSVEIVDPYGREPDKMKRIAERLHRAAQTLAARLAKQ